MMHHHFKVPLEGHLVYLWKYSKLVAYLVQSLEYTSHFSIMMYHHFGVPLEGHLVYLWKYS